MNELVDSDYWIKNYLIKIIDEVVDSIIEWTTSFNYWDELVILNYWDELLDSIIEWTSLFNYWDELLQFTLLTWTTWLRLLRWTTWFRLLKWITWLDYWDELLEHIIEMNYLI